MLDARILLPVILLVGTTTYLVGALGIASPYQDAGVGPSFFPIVIACVMYPAIGLVLLDGVRAVRAGREAEPHRILDPAKVVGLTVLYVALFRPLGYFAATTLYTLGLFFVFDVGTRNPLLRVLIAVLIAIGGYLLFREALGVRLPTLFGLDLPL